MDDKKLLEKLDGKVDKLDTRLASIDITLAKQSVILEEHTRRSLANEENVEILRLELKPVEKHVELVNGFFRLIGFLAVVAGLVEAVIHILN